MTRQTRQTSPGLTIEVSGSRRFRGLRRRVLAGQARRACRVLGVPEGEVSIHLASNAEIAALHERHKGQKGPTDVLTFDLTDRPGGSAAWASPPLLVVQLVIGAEVAGREARARGLAPGLEALRYIVHGLLHCLGEDDRDKESARRMRRRQEAVLRALAGGSARGAPEGRAAPRRRL